MLIKSHFEMHAHDTEILPILSQTKIEWTLILLRLDKISEQTLRVSEDILWPYESFSSSQDGHNSSFC